MVSALKELRDRHGDAEVVVFVDAIDRQQGVYAVVAGEPDAAGGRNALILLDED